MNEKKELEIIGKRYQEDPVFRLKYDAFIAGKKAEGNLTDSELAEVSGGFYCEGGCPRCGKYDTLVSYTFGIYNCCTECGYEEWGRGWI